MLLSRPALEAVGGLRAVQSVLAEDYLLGRKLEKAGYRVVLSPHAIATINEGWTVERFLQRHLRWGQMRRRISLGAWAAEPIASPVPLVALALLARGSGALQPLEALAAALLVIAKCALDGRLLGRLRGRRLELTDLCWIPVKDLLIAGLWPVALVKRSVCWRGNELRLGRASRLFLPAAAPLVDQAGWTSPPSTSISPQS
jgi:ceramide glucosyltransferase